MRIEEFLMSIFAEKV